MGSITITLKKNKYSPKVIQAIKAKYKGLKVVFKFKKES